MADLPHVPEPRRPNPWSRRLLALLIVVGSLGLGGRYGDDVWRLAVAVGSANAAFVLHMIGHSLDVRALAEFVGKLGTAIREVRHG